MEYITISEKYQIVIPCKIRKAMELEPKDKLVVWKECGKIAMMPIKRIKDPLATIKNIAKKPFRITVEEMDNEVEEALG